MVGASNVMAAFRLYGDRVPPQSFKVLVFMALVSLDADEHPWYGQGHEALAQLALGRPAPFTKADEKAVQRAVGPLVAVDAVEVDRRPARQRRDDPTTTRYRLNLLNGGHIPSPTVDGNRPPEE